MDGESGTRRTGNLHPTSELHGSLANADKPVAQLRFVAKRRAASIVANIEYQPRFGPQQRYGHLCRSGMARRIGERLLQDAKHVDGDALPDFLIVERGGFNVVPDTEEAATAPVAKDWHCGYHVYVRQ